MDKRFLGILALIIAVFIGIAVFSGGDNNSNSGSSSAQPTNHVEGEGKSGVRLIEYGDFQCPVCEFYYQPVNQVIAKYKDRIFFQFRNLPLVQVHPNAFAAARAAEAAGLQNKYWQMHAKLYENQSAWANSRTPSTLFEQYAKGIGLNLEQFKKDYASSQVNDAINADLAEFNRTGQQTATPTFFLDGQYISTKEVSDASGVPSVDKFSKLIDAAIAEKSKN